MFMLIFQLIMNKMSILYIIKIILYFQFENIINFSIPF